MIIDLILDRKDGFDYDAEEFYNDCFDYYQIFTNDVIGDILNALDSGTNKDVQNALCNYIDANEYNPDIKNYINSVVWVED